MTKTMLVIVAGLMLVSAPALGSEQSWPRTAPGRVGAQPDPGSLHRPHDCVRHARSFRHLHGHPPIGGGIRIPVGRGFAQFADARSRELANTEAQWQASKMGAEGAGQEQ